ncbi:hypothetical protein [Lysinibacillus sp. NPDC093688]|uniref:hypothetical protein n=1 Tax=Lysinibacillus sp. NPDC093688 TaxID=3390577 RepID=UPI003D00377F
MINIHDRMEHYRITGLRIVAIEKGNISKKDHFGVLEAGTDKKLMSTPFLTLAQSVSF